MDEDVVLLQSASSDLGGTVFIKAASAIEGRDTLEEYLACGMHPLSACISFEGITDSVTPVSVLNCHCLSFLPSTAMTKTTFSFW
jgi:hypothetical protein